MVCVYVCAVECYSVIKSNGTLSFATRTNREDLVLSKMSWAEEDKYHIISLICGV
jgi:hypothetical protein